MSVSTMESILELARQLIAEGVDQGVRDGLGALATAGDGPQLYRAEKAADRIDVSTRHLYWLVETGQLRAIDGIGRGIRIEATELQRFVESKRGEHLRAAEDAA